MEFVLFVLCVVLMVVLLLRFRQRFNAEHRRQERLTWPRARMHSTAERLELRPDQQRQGARTRLRTEYRFFSQGESHRGDRVIPEDVHVSREQATIVNDHLNKHRDGLTVRFNPRNPADNALRVGHASLSWWRTGVYVLLGLYLPASLLYLLFSWFGLTV